MVDMEKAVREWPFPDSSCTRTGGPGSCFSPRTRGQNMKLAARKKLSPLPHTSLLQDAFRAKSSRLQNRSEQKQTLPGGTQNKLFGAWAVLGHRVPDTRSTSANLSPAWFCFSSDICFQPLLEKASRSRSFTFVQHRYYHANFFHQP